MLSKSKIWRRPSFMSAMKLQTQRRFSFLSVHTSFPATMYRFQLQRESSLYNRTKDGSYFRDGVEVAQDGLVYPMLSKSQPYSNGPVFRPNTCLMQELLRSDYDLYEEQAESGGYVADPQVICIKKGTIIPSSLALFREQSSRFSLQPSHPMTLEDLNSILGEFYSTSAMVTGAMEWMERNEFHQAFADSATEDWLQY